ncbi:MAG: hypothetical protein N3H32_02765, partial [Nitrososphaeria archaeon]|nr:hypothetical protein [Nitrososphaeria archaeon]
MAQDGAGSGNWARNLTKRIERISGSQNYRMSFEMPRVFWEEVSVEESGAEPIIAEFNFRAL